MTAAREWVGTPYRHRASTPRAGCDCLGLVRGVWRSLYGGEPEAVPNYAADWRRSGDELRAAAERWLIRAAGPARAGQVVLFRLGRAARHCGILVEPGRFVHAQEGLGVIEANLNEAWSARIAGLYDFPGVTD
ncbi:MAG TPA: NlpC/P60 family protein [Hypericibacter adhaerens]|uniref:NlpC/P60 family protein n=1 Tax=Hypericibacter adhaerens TaxID=2602016 RepID=UPI002BFA4BB3|nr:NlpC/P60 family protein [Hypericibacter adhaerens]HWA42154.1 NlpC/P60 family protein [Hypericibacter adhaerens]